jgi:hypothetical protein
MHNILDQQVDLRDQIKPRMDAWSKGKQDNIRALLSTLHTVLWPDSGWKTPGLTDLVEANKVTPYLTSFYCIQGQYAVRFGDMVFSSPFLVSRVY